MDRLFDSTFIARKPLIPMLEIINPANGHKITKTLVGDCIVIGRSTAADIYVDDDKMSRNHFMIIKAGDKYEVKDLNSTNGLILNSRPAKLGFLNGNDKIVAGNTIFNFVLSRGDLDKNLMIPAKEISADSFDKKYAPKRKKGFAAKPMHIALASGLAVFIAAVMMLGNEQEAKVAPSIKKVAKSVDQIASAEQEVAASNLTEEDKIKAMNYFRLADHHFKVGNYALAKKSMESYFAMVPNSTIATPFIAACEEAITKTSGVDGKLEQIDKDIKKRELVTNLLRKGFDELNAGNYTEASSIFNKVLALDDINEDAYNGLLAIDKEMQRKQKMDLEPIAGTEITTSPLADTYAKNMEAAYKNGNYTKAYEVAQRLLVMGEDKIGKENFVKAMNTHNSIIDITNKKYAGNMQHAALLVKSDSPNDALKVYRGILADFPYHQGAKNGVDYVFKQKHEEAKLIYAKALVENSYANKSEARSKLKMVLDVVPPTDEYYRKAKMMLQRII